MVLRPFLHWMLGIGLRLGETLSVCFPFRRLISLSTPQVHVPALTSNYLTGRH
jgi:hypothetical protein